LLRGVGKTLHPASYTGLDFNPDGIAFAKKRHNLPGLDFVHGDAENLPFPDESFDVVLNVEASHAYPHFDRFLSELVRVQSVAACRRSCSPSDVCSPVHPGR
jgi:ubiquinone/menaquinone biosynthesis C-methylase UbiE